MAEHITASPSSAFVLKVAKTVKASVDAMDLYRYTLVHVDTIEIFEKVVVFFNFLLLLLLLLLMLLLLLSKVALRKQYGCFAFYFTEATVAVSDQM